MKWNVYASDGTYLGTVAAQSTSEAIKEAIKAFGVQMFSVELQ